MKRLMVMATLMLGIVGGTQAQEIKGKVVDHEGTPIAYANVVLHTTDSANDVLGKIPGVIKKGDGIEVLGKGSPVVYINGRLVHAKSKYKGTGTGESAKSRI